MSIIDIEKQIQQFFVNTPGLIAVYLYGSVVSGKIHAESDVDIAVLFQHSHMPAAMQIFEMQDTLAEELQKKVDLVCLNSVTPILQRQVLTKGKPLLVKDQHQLNLFVIKSNNMYHDLKMIRRPIEEAVLKRRVLNG